MDTKRRWIKFPLYLLEDEDGERALLPNDWQLKRMREQVQDAEAEIGKQESVKAPKGVIEFARQKARTHARQLEEAEELVRTYREQCRVLNYMYARPKFGAYIEAEERAKDWFEGTPRVDRSKFMIFLMAENVQLDGNVLTEGDVREMEPDEAPPIFEALEAACFPDPSRVPFWRSPSKT